MRREPVDGVVDSPLYEHRWLIPPVQIFVSVTLPIPLLDWVVRGGPFTEPVEPFPLAMIGGAALLPVLFYLYAVRWVNSWVRVDREGVWIDGVLAIPARRIVAVLFAEDEGSKWARAISERREWGNGRRWTLGLEMWLPTAWSIRRDHPRHGPVVVPRRNDHTRVSWLSGAIVVTDLRDDVGPVTSSRLGRLGWSLSSYRSDQLREALVAIAPRVDRLEGWGETAPAAAQD